MFLTSAAVPLNMSFPQMLSFCGIGFLVVMIVLALLSVFTAFVGGVFSSLDKRRQSGQDRAN